MTRNHRQEALSRAYVPAIAAQAGLNYALLAYDYGIDVSLRTVEHLPGIYWDIGVQLDIQVKSTTQAGLSPTHVIHDLEVRAYEHLRMIPPMCPRILVLVVMPEDEKEWLSQSQDELILRRCAYWHSLRRAAATTSTSSVRITIPRTQVFSVDVVRNMMGRLTRGEELC